MMEDEEERIRASSPSSSQSSDDREEDQDDVAGAGAAGSGLGPSPEDPASGRPDGQPVCSSRSTRYALEGPCSAKGDNGGPGCFNRLASSGAQSGGHNQKRPKQQQKWGSDDAEVDVEVGGPGSVDGDDGDLVPGDRPDDKNGGIVTSSSSSSSAHQAMSNLSLLSALLPTLGQQPRGAATNGSLGAKRPTSQQHLVCSATCSALAAAGAPGSPGPGGSLRAGSFDPQVRHQANNHLLMADPQRSALSHQALHQGNNPQGTHQQFVGGGGHRNQQHQQQRQQPEEQPEQWQQQQQLYNWQATKMTVKDRMAFLFNSTILSDVTFVVGRDSQRQRIPAHRFILSVGSAVFDAMFNSTLATKDEEVDLPDVEPASFLALLRFLYSDEVQIGPETVMTTLYTAKKYAVPALEKHCVDFLKRHLCADNAFMLLTQARLFDEPQLAALCLETIDKSTLEALAAEGFTDIDVDTLSTVLERDSLRIKESKLFAAALRWSEAECARQNLPVTPENKRSVLGNRVLTQIRFPLMTVEEFAQGPAQSGILTDRECVSLFLHFTVNPKPPVGFLDSPRCSMTGKEQTVCRFQQIESRWGYSGTSDKIRFIVDRRIFVVGFGLYGSIHGPSEYLVNIQITHTGSGRLLGCNELAFSSDGSNLTFRVTFKEPIEILPTTNYTASATLKGHDSHYGTKGLRKVTVECPTGGKVTFQFSYSAGNNNGTSVEDGQIPEIIFYT